MFTIHTARPGDAWHRLIPSRRLLDVDTQFGNDHEVEVLVRVDYGNPDGPYSFRYMLRDAYGQSENDLEVVNSDEMTRRRAQSVANGDVYDESHVVALSERSAAWKLVTSIDRHFRALMDLNLFSLPVSM